MPSSAFQTRAKEKSHFYITVGSTDRVTGRWKNNTMQYHLYPCSVPRSHRNLGTALGIFETMSRRLSFQSKFHFVNSTWFWYIFRLITKGISLISHILPSPLSLPPHTSNCLPRERSQKCISEKAFWA